jgi:transposase
MTFVDAATNPPLTEKEGLVAGIDTHKHTHHVAVVDHLGRAIADRQFPTTSAGYALLVEFLRHHQRIDRVGVEGTGSYGAGISRVLAAAGLTVIEVIRQNRQARRLHGKSDPIDARNAALSVLAGNDTAAPKSGTGQVESLRILMSERRSAVKARTQGINQIHALLITAPDTVRTAYRGLTGDKLVTTLARSRPAAGGGTDPAQIARQTLKRLATRCLTLHEEITIIDGQLEALVRSVNPRLLSLNGAGPVTAATLLAAAGDNPERLASKAAFAALTGAAPIPASSGQRVRHRLCRGGNRHANSALHRIVLLRMRHREPRTMAYIARRRAEGLTDRDIMRCLKRHVANEVYATLLNPAAEDPTGPRVRAARRQLGIPISVLAATLQVPYQRLRRLEIGTRADPELEQRAITLLAQIDNSTAA